MRVLLAGRHELAARVLTEMPSRHEVIYALPQSSAPDRGISATEIAKQRGFSTIEDSGEPGLALAIEGTKPDVLLSCGYPRIIRSDVLDRVAIAANVHFGALPRYRGSFSIPWAILNGETEIGVTLHEIHPGIDDGPIIAQEFVDDDGRSSCRDLYLRAVTVGTALAIKWLGALERGDRPPSAAQDEREATYYRPSYPNAFRIDWKQTTLQVSRYIRAAHFPPFPSAHGSIDGQTIEFDWPVGILNQAKGRCGQVTETTDGYGIAVLNGAVLPSTVTIGGTRHEFSAVAPKWVGARFS